MPNSLDPDQDPHSVGPDLGKNCLQRLSADNTIKELRAEQLYLIVMNVAVYKYKGLHGNKWITNI